MQLHFNEDNYVFGSRFYISYTSTGAPVLADLNTFAARARSAWSSDFAAYTEAALVKVETRDLGSSTGATGTDNTTVSGTLAGAALAVSNCTVTKFVIPRHYRGGKPKIYLPLGNNTNVFDVGKWSTAFVSTVDTQWGTFIANLLAASYTSFSADQHVNVGYYGGFTAVTNPVTGRTRDVPKVLTTPNVDDVTTHATDQRIGSQRRRLNT